MLKIMENEALIFRAWFRKYLKSDRAMKAIDIAKAIGVSTPAISGYHGEGKRKTWTTFEIRQAILKATDTPYEKMLETGRKALNPDVGPEIIKRIEALEQKQKPENITGIRDKRYGDVLAEFKNPETAKLICELLLRLESLDVKATTAIADYIEFQIHKKEKESPKNSMSGGV